MSEIEKIKQVYSRYMADKRKEIDDIREEENDYVILDDKMTVLVEME